MKIFEYIQKVGININISNGLNIALGMFVAFRIIISIWAVVISLIFPVKGDVGAPTFDFYTHLVADSYAKDSWFEKFGLWPWYRWDTEWYLRIAVNGYNKNGSIAFAPLYPLLIRGFGLLLGKHFLLAAIIISNIAAIFCCILFYSEVKKSLGTNTANRSLLYFLSFPTAFYLVSAYSESLFILFLFLVWKYAQEGSWPWVNLFIILALLTRFQGAGLILPLLYIWWKRDRRNKLWALSLLFSPVVLLIWIFYLQYILHLGYPWEVINKVWNQHSGWPWVGIVTNIGTMINNSSSINLHILLDTLLAVLFIALLVGVYKMLPKEYFLIMLVLFLPALMKIDNVNQLVSVSRYLLCLFPGFIILGYWGKNAIFHRVLVILFFMGQAITSAAFFMWIWVV
jgi:Gpi18-like mannosyltransferase